jgi:hypothetical protein
MRQFVTGDNDRRKKRCGLGHGELSSWMAKAD